MSANTMEYFGRPLPLGAGKTGHLVLGALDLWVRRGVGAWYVASTVGMDEDRCASWHVEDAPGDVVWDRWVTHLDHVAPVLYLAPPDRAIVVRPESSVRLLPHETTQFYFGVPLFVTVDIGGQHLGCYGSATLTTSWFGTPVEGVLCYAMRTLAHGDPTALEPRLHRCICPLEVKNTSTEVLGFERVCIRSQYLGIYAGPARYWTNAARLSYRGRQEWSRLVYARRAPREAPGAQLVSTPQWQGMGGFKLKAAGIIDRIGGAW